MGASEVFLIALLVILALPYAAWRLLRLDGYAPLVVVQIVGGILLGPGVLGRLFPAAYGFVFAKPVIAALNGVAWWAVMMFVWAAGVELDVRAAWRRRGETATTAALALAAPLATGALAGALLLRWSGWVGPHGTYGQALAGIGMACAVTALPILMLLMEQLDILRRPLGQRLLRYASLDDVAIWGVLAVILLDWTRLGRQFGFLAVFAVASLGVRFAMARLPQADRWRVALVWLAACAFAADWSGLHFMVGAFLAGVVLDAESFGREAMDAFRNTVLLTVMPVFFLSTGLRTSFEVGGWTVFAAAALLLVASVCGKLIGVYAAGALLKWRKGEAWIIGWLLQTKALIMIVFVSVLLDKGIISGAAFTALLLMAVASTVLSIPMVRGPLARWRRTEEAAR